MKMENLEDTEDFETMFLPELKVEEKIVDLKELAISPTDLIAKVSWTSEGYPIETLDADYILFGEEKNISFLEEATTKPRLDWSQFEQLPSDFWWDFDIDSILLTVKILELNCP